MSDLGFFSAKQIAPSQNLKQILAKGSWSFCQLEDSVIANVSVPWTFPLDTFGVLNFAKPCWKFFWQPKDSDRQFVALGSLVKANSQDRDTLNALSELRVFGALSFPGLEAENSLGWI